MLDRQIPYVLGVMGEGEGAAKIRRYATCAVPESERWVHVAALYWQAGWRVLDCDFDLGVVDRDYRTWVSDGFGRIEVVAVPFPALRLQELRRHIGRKFCIRKLYRFKNPASNRIGEDGLTCGELLALCDGGEMERATGKPVDEMRSVDYQMWAIRHGIVPIVLERRLV